MLDRVIFYNYYGHGDLFTSREFVKDFMGKIPSERYIYAHLRNPRILADIENLEYIHPTKEMDNWKAWEQKENTLYINTWIGRDSKYVLPGIGCVVEQFHLMYTHYAQQLNIIPPLKLMNEYIPSINYRKFYIGPTQYFVEHSTEKKVLICNEWVQSSQADNFDMEPAIKVVANRYRNILFLVTKRLNNPDDNIIYTGDITLVPDKFDIIEISYLSRFCNAIIGRASGPHAHTMVRENCMDSKKVNLTFSYNKNSKHFVSVVDIPMKRLWSPATETREVIRQMEEAINLCLP